MKSFFALIVTLLLLSCNKDDSTDLEKINLELGQNASLKNGECLDIRQTPFEICLDSVWDSRCPEGANCIWAGNATAFFSLKAGSEKKNFLLHTHPNSSEDTVIDNLHFKLIDVTPYPQLNSEIDPADYSVELLIENQ